MTTFLADMLGLSLISRMSWVKYQTRFLSTASVSVLEHSEYAEMKKQLQLATSSASGPLNVVCKYLLESDLSVNPRILHLNAIGFSSVQGGGGIHKEAVREMKRSGNLVIGHLNVKCDKIILEQFELLVSQTKVDKAALEAELLREVRSRLERDFMLQRQLVGFFLLQGLTFLGR